MMIIIYIALFLVVDWFLIDGLKRSLENFRELDQEMGYTRYLFPRSVILILSAVLFYVGAQTPLLKAFGDAVTLIALGMFVLTTIHLQVLMVVKSKKYH